MVDDPIRKELDALKADIAKLRGDIAALTDAVRDEASDKVHKTKAKTEERVRGAWEDLEEKLDEVLEQHLFHIIENLARSSNIGIVLSCD